MTGAGYAPNAYRQTQVEGADRNYLVVLLMQALLKFLSRAGRAIEERNWEAKAVALDRARAVLTELSCSLDDSKGGDLARNLQRVYAHWQTRLVAMDLSDDPAALAELEDAVGKLADAWQEALERCREQVSGAAPR
ncbi:MAG TPA: flagellar export chaperone FliS [Armatimonadota bacterium]|nr:flagellar export chaperone FliS [Armatimonadota bacterium]